MKLNVFGRRLEIEKVDREWIVYSLGEGKRRREIEIVIPSHYTDDEAVTYLADLFHESATPANSEVKIISR